MPGRRDAISNGRLIGRCGAGRAEGGPCRCGCTAACTSGNQCAYYALFNPPADATDPDCEDLFAGIRATPWLGAIDGYTDLGGGFDAALTHSFRDALSIRSFIDGRVSERLIEISAWTLNHTVRCRYAPYPLKQDQLVALLGAAVNPAGWQLVFPYRVYTDAGNDDGDFCAALWADVGKVTGVASAYASALDSAGEPEVFLDYETPFDEFPSPGAAQEGLPVPGANTLTLSTAYNPLNALTQLAQSNRFFAIMPGVPADGIAYMPFGPVVARGVERFRRPGVFLPLGGGIAPFNTTDPGYDACDATLAEAVLLRQGGGGVVTQTRTAGTITETANAAAGLAVSYGLNAAAAYAVLGEYVFEDSDFVFASTFLSRARSAFSERAEMAVTPVACPSGSAALSLTPISCGDTAEGDFLVAFPCSGEGTLVAYDPDDAGGGDVTLIYQRRRYELTDIPTTQTPPAGLVFSPVACGQSRVGYACDDPAVTHPYDATLVPAGTNTFRVGTRFFELSTDEAVLAPEPVDEWLAAACPADAEFYLATKCSPSAPGPAAVRYRPHATIPVGDGRLLLAVNTSFGCYANTQYEPTTTPTTDETLPIGEIRSGTACGPNVTLCLEDVTPDLDLDQFCNEFCVDYTGSDPFILGFCATLCVSRSAGGEEEGGGGGFALMAGPVGEDTGGTPAAPAGKSGGLRAVASTAARFAAKVWTAGEMVAAYADARASGRHATPETIALRRLSCFGDGSPEHPACDKLRTAADGRRFCGACGCGARAEAMLDPDDAGRSKLQFTRLTCPLKKPGFSNAGEGEEGGQ